MVCINGTQDGGETEPQQDGHCDDPIEDHDGGRDEGRFRKRSLPQGNRLGEQVEIEVTGRDADCKRCYKPH